MVQLNLPVNVYIISLAIKKTSPKYTNIYTDIHGQYMANCVIGFHIHIIYV